MAYTVEQAYSDAYKTHYNKKNYEEAYRLYLAVINGYPNSNEARYAKQQIENLKKILNIDSIQLDSDLETVRDAMTESDANKQRINKENEEQKKKETEAYNARKQAIEEAKSNMMLSTCPSIEGFRAVQQFGLVFGEILFKSGFMNRIQASFDNATDLLSFGDQEMTGTTALLENARKYAIEKMITQAAKKGANAIVGIDFESSAGGSIIHITVSGTAVRIEPIE